jgi:hypothetical protein
MPFEAKRFRHVAVTVSKVLISRGVVVSPRQKCAEPQQPDVANCYTFVARGDISWRTDDKTGR